jgi:hypothetical protein
LGDPWLFKAAGADWLAVVRRLAPVLPAGLARGGADRSQPGEASGLGVRAAQVPPRFG